MKICQPHYERLKKAIDERGLTHLIAKTAEDAFRAAVTELEGRGAENDFDPLMAANNLIMAQGISQLGLALLGEKPDGGDYCPICERAKITEEVWIQSPADEVLKIARDRGLVPPATPPD